MVCPAGQNLCQNSKLHFFLEIISVYLDYDNQSTDTNGVFNKDKGICSLGMSLYAYLQKIKKDVGEKTTGFISGLGLILLVWSH